MLYVKSVVTKEGYKAPAEFAASSVAKFTPTDEPSATWTWTCTAKTWSANETKTINGKNWTLAGDGKYWGYDASKGQQLGSGNNPYKSMTLTTNFGDNYRVKTIKVNSCGGSKISATMTVSVGGTTLTPSSVSLTASATEYTFTTDTLLTGEIVISWTQQTTAKAIYLKSITIN